MHVFFFKLNCIELQSVYNVVSGAHILNILVATLPVSPNDKQCFVKTVWRVYFCTRTSAHILRHTVLKVPLSQLYVGFPSSPALALLPQCAVDPRLRFLQTSASRSLKGRVRGAPPGLHLIVKAGARASYFSGALLGVEGRHLIFTLRIFTVQWVTLLFRIKIVCHITKDVPTVVKDLESFRD